MKLPLFASRPPSFEHCLFGFRICFGFRISDFGFTLPGVPTTPEPNPRRVLLLGLGNDLLTDDAIGLRVAVAARDQLKAHPNVTVIESSEMGLSLLDLVTGYDDLVVVDAVQTGQSPPGHVHEFDTTDLQTLPLASPHFLGLGETLALGRRLALPVPTRVKILAIEVQDPFTVGTRLTPALESALPQLVQRAVSACALLASQPPAEL